MGSSRENIGATGVRLRPYVSLYRHHMPDVVVIGGGIAGVSAAYYLAPHAEVTVVEREPVLAYHTTGRSAALLFENYGSAAIRPLTRASLAFLRDPPADLVDGALLSRRGGLVVGRPEQTETLRAGFADALTAGRVDWVDEQATRALAPCIREGYAGGGVWDPDACDIDVASLHQAFVRGLRRSGGNIITAAPVTSLHKVGERWRVEAGESVIEAAVVVNASGAWGDEVAAAAAVATVRLQPMRRTVFMVAGSDDARQWPMVIDADEQFYFKPDGPQILCSPADETPSPPCDARPEQIDIALAIERINAATTLGIRSVRSSWAGLRTFTPDRAPVTGFEPSAAGFFWLVGQGGTGIQTSPGAGRLAASLILDGKPPADMVQAGLTVDMLSPLRLR